jgi:hypothetical protein
VIDCGYAVAVERVLLDQVIETDYGQLNLAWGEDGTFDGDFDRFYGGQVNGLVGAANWQGVHVNLARRSGGSPVRIVLFDAAPGIDNGQWEDIVEVSITLPEGHEMAWSAWAGFGSGPISLPSGSYRLRVSAKGRDEGHLSEFAEGTVDDYLLQLWPTPWQPDAILLIGSEDAEYWHREVGSRR